MTFFITLKNAFAALFNMFNLTSTEMREGELSSPPPLHKDLLKLSFYQPSPTLINLIKYAIRGKFTIWTYSYSYSYVWFNWARLNTRQGWQEVSVTNHNAGQSSGIYMTSVILQYFHWPQFTSLIFKHSRFCFCFSLSLFPSIFSSFWKIMSK